MCARGRERESESERAREGERERGREKKERRERERLCVHACVYSEVSVSRFSTGSLPSSEHGYGDLLYNIESKRHTRRDLLFLAYLIY